jgi:NADPH:quinone reductase-like Zn-dependent oxidoreductase
MMKAVRMHTRSGAEALVFEDAPMPQLRLGDALVKVHAAGITPTEFTWNSTFTSSDGKARVPIVPSFEVSGTVDRLESKDADLKVGDEVYGLLDFWRDGAAAEYVSVQVVSLALKPRTIDHIHAAAVPLSALTAWQALFDHAKISKGNRVLIHGAGGGVGTFAVQLAHWRGAHVIGTSSKSKFDFLKELGADELIDYTSIPFEDTVKDIDTVLDTVGGETLDRSWKIVRRGGTLVTIVGDAPEEKSKEYGINAVSFLVQPNRTQLNQISRLVDDGVVRSVVEATYPLREARQAYERGLLGHNRGKLVLKVLD